MVVVPQLHHFIGIYVTFQMIAFVTFVLLSSMSSAVATTPNVELEMCKDLCEMAFRICITDACPFASFPREAPKYCLDSRVRCIEDCIEHYTK